MEEKNTDAFWEMEDLGVEDKDGVKSALLFYLHTILRFYRIFTNLCSRHGF